MTAESDVRLGNASRLSIETNIPERVHDDVERLGKLVDYMAHVAIGSKDLIRQELPIEDFELDDILPAGKHRAGNIRTGLFQKGVLWMQMTTGVEGSREQRLIVRPHGDAHFYRSREIGATGEPDRLTQALATGVVGLTTIAAVPGIEMTLGQMSYALEMERDQNHFRRQLTKTDLQRAWEARQRALAEQRVREDL